MGREMPEDIKKLSEEVAKMGATIIDMILAWCKESGHNPYFILGIIGQRLYYHSKNSDFNELIFLFCKDIKKLIIEFSFVLKSKSFLL